jgi:hypothetical protein
MALSEEVGAFLTASRRAERSRKLALAGLAALVLGTVAAITVLYLKAANSEKDKAQAELKFATEKQRDAEARTREVQAAQARIDQLLKDLKESPKKDEIQALQQRILAGTGSAPAELATRRRAPLVERRATTPAEAPPPAAAPHPSAPPSTLKVQSEW